MRQAQNRGESIKGLLQTCMELEAQKKALLEKSFEVIK
jgi:hypothetical protein